MNKRLVAILVLILVAIIIISTSIMIITNNKKDAHYDVYINGLENEKPESDLLETEGEEVKEEEKLPIVDETPIIETPVDDTYELASVPVEFDPLILETAELSPVTDPVVLEKIDVYIEKFHFNYFFLKGINPENGNVDINGMTLFALAYIMQNEHNDLRFDTSTFRLYIPKDHVIEVVQRYFQRQLDVFAPYPDYEIDYIDEVYSVEVHDEKWNEDLMTESVQKLGDFTYKVTCAVMDRSSQTVVRKIHAIIDENKNGLVLVNYKVEEITQ